MNKKKKEKIMVYSLLVILFIIIIIIYLLLDSVRYDYKHISGSYLAQDDSYLVLNKDKTFYWYIDKDNKKDYYYGTYTVYRGENAIDYITKELYIFEISEEEQRQTIDNMDLKNAIDHYYLINLSNEKLVLDKEETKMFKDTRYYGFANENYDEFDLLNLDADNYAVFIRDK
jgi:hypothetical protein